MRASENTPPRTDDICDEGKKAQIVYSYELVCADFFKHASSLQTYDTSYAASQNLYKSRVRTTAGKQIISYMASIF